MIKAFKQWRCNMAGHTYGEGVSCPFTGNTYHYCSKCGIRKTIRADKGVQQHG